MTIALIIIACALLAAVLALAGLLAGRLLPGPPLRGRTVTVNTRRPDDQTIKGVLVSQHADRLTLMDAVYVTPAGEQPIGGQVHIPTGAVAWLQDHHEG